MKPPISHLSHLLDKVADLDSPDSILLQKDEASHMWTSTTTEYRPTIGPTKNRTETSYHIRC